MNRPEKPTYICHNCLNSVGLVFVNDMIKTILQHILLTSAMSPTSNHLPIITTVVMLTGCKAAISQMTTK
jgi:hypothetical protein